MTLTNQALSSAADKDLELSKQVCREAVNEVIEKNHLTLSPQFTQNLVVHLAIAILRIKTNNYIPLSQGQITSYKANTNYDSAVEICNILSKKFDIEILNIENQKTPKSKTFKIHITDKELLQLTGGIVQGMSGTPIVQGDKIIGAISHAVENDPTTGYAVFIKWMIEK